SVIVPDRASRLDVLGSLFHCYGDHRDLPSFPTRRSSDLPAQPSGAVRRMKAPREGQIMSERFERHRQPWRSDEVAKLKVLASKRSEEHTSELQSRENLVCRLLLEKKKKTRRDNKQSSDKR